METGRPTGVSPVTAPEGTGGLRIVEEEFVNVYDAPFIIVNRINGDLQAWIDVHPDNEARTWARIQMALDVARSEGEEPFAMKVGELAGVILIAFTPMAIFNEEA